MLKFFLLVRLYLYPLVEYLSFKSHSYSVIFLPVYWRFFWAVERRLETLELGFKGTSLYQSERATLIEHILFRKLNPQVLEIGIGFGQNIAVLTELLPQKNICGIDIKKDRIADTQKFLEENNITGVQIEEGDGRVLAFNDGTFDVVFTSAVMLYLPFDDCKKMLAQMLRVAKDRVVLLEQHREGDRDVELSGGVTGGSYFVRDYNLLIQEVLAELQIEASLKKIKIENPRWQVESWKDMACVFVIDKKVSSSVI